ADPSARQALVEKVVSAVLPSFDALTREYCYQTNRDFERGLQPTLLARLVEHLGDQMVANGSLNEPLTAGEVGELCRVLQPDALTELAAEPTQDGVARLARAAGRHLMETRHLRSADPYCYQRTLWNSLTSGWDALLGQAWPDVFTRICEDVRADHRRLWREHVRRLDAVLIERAAGTFTRLAIEDVLFRSVVKDPRIATGLVELKRLRAGGAQTHEGHHHDMGMKMTGRTPSLVFDPIAAIDPLQTELTQRFAHRLLLWRKERADLIGQGGELDRVMQMPGWVNVWTMPIQNRVDMLATGVNTQVGVRVLGHNLEDVVAASEKIAAVLKGIRGAVGVVADPVRGRGYLEISPRWDRAAQLGVSTADVNALIETALGGKVVTTSVENRERYPVRVRFPRDSRRDEETIRRLLVPVRGRSGAVDGKAADRTAALSFVPLSEVADVAIRSGPANIKSENGLLRNYVYLNVQDRDVEDFVNEARRVVAEQVPLPQGVQVEWTGQFEHEIHARNMLLVMVPLVILSIFGVLYWTYHDLADALLMLLAVPGALAGGILCQWLFGYKFSVTLWIGYIACFGMVTSTGIIMLVYLRDALAQAGGLTQMSLHQLREAVMAGAVQRLRPKLLTECTTVIGLAPLLWAGGTGAEIIKPMVVPVLGGLLMADEVIDLLLPVLFYHVRRRRWERLHRSAPPISSAETSSAQQYAILS
ncbi:MAG TPA: efflux RND transporter permease subunit, partial [Gemmataceae bacterium]|nr:efflux RND transporter permease subunit [Gemmataceae bacterium]